MKVRTVHEITGTDRDVEFNGGRSLRLILSKDKMGFSFHKTIIPKGGPHNWHYKYHLEACYCVQGRGVITDLKSGNTYTIKPDSIYILDNHDNHTFEALEDTVLLSVFNPPVVGDETHREDGSYALLELH